MSKQSLPSQARARLSVAELVARSEHSLAESNNGVAKECSGSSSHGQSSGSLAAYAMTALATKHGRVVGEGVGN